MYFRYTALPFTHWVNSDFISSTVKAFANASAPDSLLLNLIFHVLCAGVSKVLCGHATGAKCQNLISVPVSYAQVHTISITSSFLHVN